MQFLCDSLRRLGDDLDGPLLVTRGRPEDPIPVLVKEIEGDVTLRKGGRPAGYPEPMVDHTAERVEALRRYHSMS